MLKSALLLFCIAVAGYAEVRADTSCIDDAGQTHNNGDIYGKDGVCDKYFQCVNGNEEEMMCPAGTAFDPSINACNFLENVPQCQDTNGIICASNPCENGATCYEGTYSYTCDCVAGYSGVNCETDIDDCAWNPCKNGATCVDGINEYTCECADEYSGYHCKTRLSNCTSNPCENDAVCTAGVDATYCDCGYGYSGELCGTADVDVDIGCYTYRRTPTAYPPLRYNWYEAREYCQYYGGDLAYHGFESLSNRRNVLCNKLGLCNQINKYGFVSVWLGLKKESGTWQYLDGTTAIYEDIHWTDSNQQFEDGCAYVHTGPQNHLKKTSSTTTCDGYTTMEYAICEFKC
jgi:hypothetical protein